MPTTGISRRALARTRGISEAAVRAHISSGVLTEALLPDGTIDPDKADKLLAAAITRPKTGKVAPVLRLARSRRQRAQARDLQDEVEELRRALVQPGAAEVAFNDHLAGVIEIARRWPAMTAPAVAGKPAAEAQRLLKLAINQMLGEMHDNLSALEEAPDTRPSPPEPDLDAMTAVQLAALIEHLRAELLELGRLERQQHLVRLGDALALTMEAVAIAKSVLLALPGRTSQLIEHADVPEAQRLLAVEIDGFVAAAHIDLSPLVQGAQK